MLEIRDLKFSVLPIKKFKNSSQRPGDGSPNPGAGLSKVLIVLNKTLSLLQFLAIIFEKYSSLEHLTVN